MSHTALTRPLVCYTTYAKWIFHRPSGPAEILYQANPSLKHPKAIVPIVLAAADKSSSGGNVRSYLREADIPVGRAAQTPPTDPVARKLWDAWVELYTESDVATLPRTARPMSWAGYTWEVWSGADPIDGAFRMLDWDKSVVGLYDLTRRPFADLADALGVGDALATILKEVS